MSPILLGVVVIVFIAWIFRHARSRPSNFPPGPARLPIWGNLWQVLLKNYHAPHKALLALSKDFHSPVIGVYVGAFPTVVANDFESVREMLSHPQFQGRPKGFMARTRAFNRLHGIFFTDGDYWGNQRRFSLRHMRDFGFGRRFDSFEAIVLEEVQGVVNILKGCLTPYDKDIARDGLVMIPDVFAAASTNTVLAVLTGTRLAPDQFPASRLMARHVVAFQRGTNAAGGAVDATPWARFFVPGSLGYPGYKTGNDQLMAFVLGQIADHRETFDNEVIRGFCDKFMAEMKVREGENSPFTDLQMTLTLMDYVLPAASAIPAALGFAIQFMIKYPECADRAHDEIKEVVGLDRLPDLNDRVKLPYTEAFLREVLRMTGTPLTVTHRATEDSKFRGFDVPQDTLIIPNMWAAHHDPKVFEKPFEFRPERFLQPENGQLQRRDPSVPFGLGARLCAGETFARQNSFVFLAALLQGFRFSLPEGVAMPDVERDGVFGLIVTVPDDMWVQVSERS